MLHAVPLVLAGCRAALRPPARKREPLSLTRLEPRDNPAIPVGLTDVQLLPIDAFMPASPGLTYSEHHSVSRAEANTLTVDEAGTGSSGTFSIDFTGSSESDDTVEGSGGASDFSTTTEGSGHNEYSFHLVISGEYADGVMTITSETYTETGSYSNTQAITLITAGGTDRWDVASSGSYTLSWTAATSEGQLTYTSFSAESTDTAHWRRQTTSAGVETDATWDDVSTAQTSGSGTEANYTGSILWHQYRRTVSGGSEETTEWSSTTPVSGTAWIGTPYRFTDVGWYAGTYDATGYTFHGETTETASLTEEATLHTSDGSNWQFDVDSFNSSSHNSDMGHVVDDEPAVPESGTGTESYHRDEMHSYSDDVTGSGSYVGGAGDADYHAVETAAYSAANSYVVDGDEESGYGGNGAPFDRVYNYSGTTTGSGSVTNTHDYHDTGSGLALSWASFVGSGSSQMDWHSWGTLDGQAFDDTSSTPESWSSSVSAPGDPTPVNIADGADEAFPVQGMETPNQVFFTAAQLPVPQPIPLSVVPGPAGTAQSVYNNLVVKYGGRALKLGAKEFIKENVILEMLAQPTDPPATGTFTHPKGQLFSIAFGLSSEVDKANRRFVKEMEDKQTGYKSIKLDSVTVVIDYAVDQPNLKFRSGKIALQYRVVLNYSATTAAGLPIKPMRIAVTGGVQVHDSEVETMTLKP